MSINAEEILRGGSMNQDEYMEQDFKARPRFSGQRMGRLKSGKTVQDEIGPEDLERIRAFIAGHRWVFAKTMPQHPHEYTLRKNAVEEEFLFFVEYIRQHGYDQKFGKSATYIYLNVDGRTYWTMGDTIPYTILINRAKLEP